MFKMDAQNTKFYRTKEVLKIIGISRATLYNWLRSQKVKEVARDRNNFRIFTETDIHKILEYKNLIKQPNVF